MLADCQKAWLGGIGRVPLFHHMEDAVTVEIIRAPVYPEYSGSFHGLRWPSSYC